MKKSMIIKAVFCALVLSFANNLCAAEYRITNPDLLEKESLTIRTEWDFYWKKNVHELNTKIKPDLRVSVPSEWNKYNLTNEDAAEAKNGQGAGTYRLRITNLKPDKKYAFPVYKLGYTAFRIYVNGEDIYNSGIPSVKWEKTVMEQHFDKAVFSPDEDGNAEIAVFISNAIYRKGGFRGSFILSEENVYVQNYTKELCLYGIFGGILLMVALYCLLTALMKKDKTNLFLGVLVIGIISRVFSDIFPLLKEIFPGLPFNILLRLEYLSLFTIPAMHTWYFDSLNKKIFGKHLTKILVAPAFVLLILNLTLPIYYANRMVLACQIYMFTVGTIDIILSIISSIRNRDFISVTAVLSFVILIIGTALTVLSIQRVIFINNGWTLTTALLLYSLCQISLLAYIQNRNSAKVIELNNYLVETNKAYFRFVPEEFLNLLSKKDITEVSLGEYKISRMAILSADIRNFTATSEKLTPIQVFDMLNSYLGKVAPLIRKYNGIIEKYLGDGIIAIFPESALSALNCAIEMQEQMIELRQEFQKKGMPLIKIGIGVHYGNIVIGTGGGNDRMTEISLSDDIDVAIKTEAATKIYRHPILATVQAVGQAATEARHKGITFQFFGQKISEELFSIHNHKIGNVL